MRRTVCLLACIMMTAATVNAQDKSAEVRKILTQSSITVEFANAPLKSVASTIAKMMNGKTNIVVHPKIADEPITVRLANTNLVSTLNVLQRFVPNLEVELNWGLESRKLKHIERPFTRNDDTAFQDFNGVITIMFNPEELDEETETHVFYVKELVKENALKIEDLAAALETAWKMQGDVGTPKVTYHAETGLLMCTANESGLRAADQVISQLPGGDDVLERSRESRTSKENPRNRVVSSWRRSGGDWRRRDEPQTEEERERHEEMRKRMEERIKRFREKMLERRKKDGGEAERDEAGERRERGERGKPPWAGRDGDKEGDEQEEDRKDGDREADKDGDRE